MTPSCQNTDGETDDAPLTKNPKCLAGFCRHRRWPVVVNNNVRYGKTGLPAACARPALVFESKSNATANLASSVPVATNLLNQNFTVQAPGRIWIDDITYIGTGNGRMCPAVLLDLFNGEVVGWSASSAMTRQKAIGTLQVEIGVGNSGKRLLHSFARGSRYASAKCRKMLKKHTLICSISRKATTLSVTQRHPCVTVGLTISPNIFPCKNHTITNCCQQIK